MGNIVITILKISVISMVEQYNPDNAEMSFLGFNQRNECTLAQEGM